jgi:hypothetical protein
MIVENGKNLKIEGAHGTFFVPHVHFNADTEHCLIEGESYLEDAFEFYDNLIKWFEEYFQAHQQVVLDFRLSYFNTSSSRALVDLIRALKLQQEKGKKVTINWYYPEPDYDDMRLEGEDFMHETGMELNFISYAAE